MNKKYVFKKSTVFILVLTLMLSLITPMAQSSTFAAELANYGDMALEYTRYLSKELEGPRVAGSEHEVEAANYIKGEFERIGYDVDIHEFSYTRQDQTYDSQNLIAVKEGASEEQVIVGAHYDQVTAGGSEGAHDNAGSIGAVLETAERIKDIETEYTIVFIAFGAEEVGLRGSNAYVADMSAEEIENTVAMVNLDSIIAGDYAYAYAGSNGIGWVREQALAISDELGLDLITQDGLHPDHRLGETGNWSDHAPFNAAGIPIVYFESTNWLLQDEDGNYMDGYVETEEHGAIMHTERDNLDFIEENFPGRIAERFDTMIRVLERLLIEIEPIEAEPNPELNKEDNIRYIYGYEDETVRPNGFMTREGAASVFYRLLTEEFKESVETTTHNFTDVAKDRWSNDAIATLANANILVGYGDGTFKPGGSITRAEVVKIASQFEQLNMVDENDFIDINNGHWAKDEINSAADKGWIIGYPDQTFRPNQSMTRAEFVTLVNKVLERAVDLDNLPEDAIGFPDLNESSWYYGDMMMAINHF